jgi:hypothetical protein
MKLLLIMFVFVCLNSPQPSKEGKKKAVPAKHATKASFNLAPSILIIHH